MSQVYRPNGGGDPIGNSPLTGNTGAGAGLGQYGAPNSGVVNQRKPRPRGVQPEFPLVTNQPGPLTPPPKPTVMGMPVWGGPGAAAPPTSGFQGMGNDMFYANGQGQPIRPPSPTRPGSLPDESGTQYRPPAPAAGFQGYGNDMFRASGMPAAGQANQFGWSPLMMGEQVPAGMRMARSGSGANLAASMRQQNRPVPSAMLPNAVPQGGNPMAGTMTSLPGGWWNNPLYANSNGGGWWNDPTGAGQNLNRAMAGGGPGQSQGDTGFLGGYHAAGSGGGGGGGGSGNNSMVQPFVDSMNEANKLNRDRQGNITSGWEAMKNWIAGQYGGLGEQQRKDINTTFDKEKGRLTQDMISRGLTSSTVLDNMQKGNERTRGEALARLDDDLTRNMVQTTLPVWTKELDFLNGINEKGPDLGLMAQLLQQAGAAGPGGNGGGYGAAIPMNVDMSGMDYGYGQMGSPVGYGGGMMGYGGGSQMQRGTRPSYSIPGFPGTYPTGRGGGMGRLPPSMITDPDLTLDGRYPDEYDYSSLFGDGPGGMDYF